MTDFKVGQRLSIDADATIESVYGEIVHIRFDNVRYSNGVDAADLDKIATLIREPLPTKVGSLIQWDQHYFVRQSDNPAHAEPWRSVLTGDLWSEAHLPDAKVLYVPEEES